MYCPSCGKTNSSEQKFCRSRGLNLEDTTRSLILQLPTGEQDRRLAGRKRTVERVLSVLVGGGITAFVSLIIFTIISELIIGSGQVVQGIVFIAFLLALVLAALLVNYRKSLIEATGRRELPNVHTLPADPATRQLADPYFEPVPSVTENTTELLRKEGKSEN